MDSLEKNNFNRERRSVDMGTLKKKKFVQAGMHARKLSHAPGTKVEFVIENASSTMPNLKSRNLVNHQAQTEK